MKTLLHFVAFLTVLHHVIAYSKYGRTCKDIGCLNNEECVMAEDPCSYYSRDNCGTYPTCKAKGSTSAPSCEGYTCPPTQICHLDNGTPKCVPATSTSTRVSHNEKTQNSAYPAQNPSYPAQNPSYPAQNPSYPAQNPSYPSAPASGGLYPSLTTTRPAMQGGGYRGSSGGYAGSPPNSGYPGGAPNSGYPGYPSQGYPSQGYPNQGYPNQGYPNQGYPNQGYPSQGYPSQGYPNQGYPNQGYNQRYPSQSYPGYSGYPAQSSHNRQSYGGQTYESRPKSTASNPIVDKITDQLKTIGTGLLKNALGLNKN